MCKDVALPSWILVTHNGYFFMITAGRMFIGFNAWIKDPRLPECFLFHKFYQCLMSNQIWSGRLFFYLRFLTARVRYGKGPGGLGG